jgi:kynurenine formamidase
VSLVDANLPDYDALPLRGGIRCSWGLWGDHDVFGCLNLLTSERAVEASREVQRGDVFSLNWSMALPDPPLFGRHPMRHEIRSAEGSRSQDDQLQDWNTQASSQWDGFRHVRREGHGHYNGVPDGEHGVHHWAERGIVGRALLVDVARQRESVGRPLKHGTPDPITADDILAAADAQGSTIQEGDILLLRTGWISWYMSLDTEARALLRDRDALFTPGLLASEDTASALWNLHIAAIAADNPALEVWPLGAFLDAETVAAILEDPEGREHEMQLHTHLLPMLGLPIGELFALDALADDCAADGRYTCFFTSAPIGLPGGIASPPNALALK